MATSHRPRLTHALIAALAVTATSACGGDSSITGSTAVASVTLSENAATLRPGETKQLSATARASDGSALSGRTITWASSSEAVATVSDNGLVTAVGFGNATIVASSEGKQGEAAISVVAPVGLVVINPAAATLQVGSTRQLEATPMTAAGDPLAGRNVTWRSSNTTVASVSSSGLVTARAAGTATITATSEGVEGTAEIGVTAGPPPADNDPPVLVSLEIEPDTVSIAGGEATVTVTMRITDVSGVQSITVNLRSPAQDKTVATVVYVNSGGTRTDGIWTATLRIPADAALGNWTLSTIALFDVGGRTRLVHTADLVAAGFETTVHVEN